MSTVTDLLARRRAAIEAGDKALGREIYHHLQTLGLAPHEIDAPALEESQERATPPVLETRPVTKGRRTTPPDAA